MEIGSNKVKEQKMEREGRIALTYLSIEIKVNSREVSPGKINLGDVFLEREDKETLLDITKSSYSRSGYQTFINCDVVEIPNKGSGRISLQAEDALCIEDAAIYIHTDHYEIECASLFMRVGSTTIVRDLRVIN